MSRTTKRARLVAIVRRNVDLLAKRGRHHELEYVMELTGYLSNRSCQTSQSLANAIVGLATVMPYDDLESTAHGSVFYRLRRCMTWERADKFADDALRAAGCDVDRFNALHEDGEEYDQRCERGLAQLASMEKFQAQKAAVN